MLNLLARGVLALICAAFAILAAPPSALLRRHHDHLLPATPRSYRFG